MPFISENRENLPVLVVDKKGEIGLLLCRKLSKESTTVFVSSKGDLNLRNVIHVPFSKDIPKVPDNTYSHIFIVDDGEDITFEYLPSFLEKAREDKAVFCFCTDLTNQQKIPSHIFEYSKSKVLVLGDIFPSKEPSSSSYVNRFLNQAQKRSRIEVPQDGMDITHPVFIEDAVSGILEAAFETSSNRTFLLFSKHGISLLSLAHLIQKNDPSITIDFSNEETEKIPEPIREGKYLLPERYDLEGKVRNLNIKAGTTRVSENFKKAKLNLRLLPNLRIALFSMLLFLFLPLLTTLVFSFFGGLFLDISKSQNSKDYLALSQGTFHLASNFLKVLVWENSFANISLVNKLTNSIEEGSLQTDTVLDYYKGLDLLSAGKIDQGINSLRNFLIFSQGRKISRAIDKSVLNFISQTINVWPQILAVDSKKKYLILFQNDNVPRPTGGEIQVFGILSLENGKAPSFKVYDTSESDKKLKGHIEPPFAIRRYLKSLHLYLKDSNFNPEFTQSAESASFILDLEEGEKVDGVLAVDLNFLSGILGEKVRGQNIKEEVTNLKDKLKSESLVKMLLTPKFVDMLGKKDILFASNDKSIQSIFSANNLSSTIPQNSENRTSINDFVGVIESDLGGPVSFIERDLRQNVSIAQDGKITSDLSFEIKNSGDSEYKNYIRFYVPQNFALKKIKINGADREMTDAITDPSVYESKDFKTLEKLEVESYNQSGKSVFGFFIKIPQNDKAIIDLTFEGKSDLISQASHFSYGLHFFKQPGIEPYPYKFSISAPDFKTGNNTFMGNTEKDFDLIFNFTK